MLVSRHTCVQIISNYPCKRVLDTCKFQNGVAIRTTALRIIGLMLLIRTAALCTVLTHSLLRREADNQSQYLIYIT